MKNENLSRAWLGEGRLAGEEDTDCHFVEGQRTVGGGLGYNDKLRGLRLGGRGMGKEVGLDIWWRMVVEK